MKPFLLVSRVGVALSVLVLSTRGAEEAGPHRQLPKAMHGTMTERPTVRVGVREGDFVGNDNRVLQAAIDYLGALGGGTLEIGEGEFRMRDSLHLRAHVTVRGRGAGTVLRKAKAAVSPLEIDGDFGEEQVTLKDPGGFEVGDGIAVWDDNAHGFHRTVARITGRNGNTFSLDVPLISDCMAGAGAKAATVFPVVSGSHLDGVRIEDLAIEGNREENVNLDGCRDCVARDNGDDGLYLCWRVKNGLFEGNRLERNGRFGISIGHKDTDNLLRNNRVVGNGADGVFFRNETVGMAGHRNRLEDNLIEDNGAKGPAAGIRVRGETRDLVLKGNTIRDTRDGAARSQTVGIRLEEKVGVVELDGNRIEVATAVEDRRPVR